MSLSFPRVGIKTMRKRRTPNSPITVSNQTIRFGALTTTNAGGAKAVASDNSELDITSVTYVSGPLSTGWSVSSGRLRQSGALTSANGTVLSCVTSLGTIQVTIATDANAYDIISGAELSAVMTAHGSSSTATTIYIRPDITIAPWDDNWFTSRTHTALLTIRSRNNNRRATMQLASVANAVAAMTPRYYDFYQINFTAEFDRTQHTALSYMLTPTGTQTGPLKFRDCTFTGTSWDTIGPGPHFRGIVGNGFTKTDLVEVTDCTISNTRRGGTFVGGSGLLTLDRNTVTEFSVDGLNISGVCDSGSSISDNIMHSPRVDTWRLWYSGGSSAAYYQRTAGLTGEADGKKCLLEMQVEFDDNIGSGEDLFSHGGLTLKRLSTGHLEVRAKDSGGTDRVTLTASSTSGSYRRVHILVSIDTDATSYLSVYTEGALGAGSWATLASAVGGGHTLDFTGSCTIGQTVAGREFYITRTMYWLGTAPDVTSATVQGYFADSIGMIKDSTVARDVYGTPLIDFYGTSIVSKAADVAPANYGSGGTFTKTGTIEMDHGDMIQMQPQANITGYTLARNILLSCRFDALKDGRFDFSGFQGIFCEDIGAANNYNDFEVYHNFVLCTSVHGVRLYNATNCSIYGNTAALDPTWTNDYNSKSPQIGVLQHQGGTASGNLIYDNVAKDVSSFVADTLDNNIETRADDVGSTAYSSLFTGDGVGGYSFVGVSEALEVFTPKAGGALASAYPVIGAAGTYANFDANTSNTSPRSVTVTAFTVTDSPNQNLNALVTSSGTQITGVGSDGAYLIATGSGSPQVRVTSDSGGLSVVTDWTSGGARVDNNQYIWVRATASSASATARNITVSVGATTDTWTITTKSVSIEPLVQFDGTNDYLVGNLAGTTQTTGFTLSCWIDLTGGDGSALNLINFHSRISVTRNSSNKFSVEIRNTSNTIIWAATTDATYTLSSDLIHLAIAFDGGGSPQGQIYINGSAAAFTNTTSPAAGTIQWDRGATNSGIMATAGGTGRMNAKVGGLWINNSFHDLSVNIGDFYDGGGTADLGTTGQNPTGSTPLVFFSGNATYWNAGGGEGTNTTWTMTGSVVDA